MHITEDLREIAEEMQRDDILPWITYIENEDDDCVRIDYRGGFHSLWLYRTGETSKSTTLPPKCKKFLIQKGFNLPN